MILQEVKNKVTAITTKYFITIFYRTNLLKAERNRSMFACI
jgi:hypothetical protein